MSMLCLEARYASYIWPFSLIVLRHSCAVYIVTWPQAFAGSKSLGLNPIMLLLKLDVCRILSQNPDLKRPQPQTKTVLRHKSQTPKRSDSLPGLGAV